MPVVSARYGDGRPLAQAYIGPHAGRQQVARQRGRRPTLKVAQLSSATASGQRSATSLASMIRRYIIWRDNHACRFMISWCQAGRVAGPGGRFSFASIAWRPRTSRAVQFNFTGRQVALQVGRRPDPAGSTPRGPGRSGPTPVPAQHSRAQAPLQHRRIRQKVRGRTKAEVREKLQALHRELEAGLRVSATYTVASCIRAWLGRRTHDAAGQHRREITGGFPIMRSASSARSSSRT
jgi:hypothetical protein